MAAKLEKILKKARALREKGKLERALKHYRSACDEADSGAEVWAERAGVAQQVGELQEAVSALYRAAEMCAKLGQREGAEKFAERVLGLDPGHKGAKALAPRPEVEEIEIEPDPEPDSEAEADPEAEAEAEAESDPEADSDSAPEVEAELVPEPATKAETESNLEAGSEVRVNGEAEAPKSDGLPEPIESPVSGKLALAEISLLNGDGEQEAELPLDIPEPGGRSVRAATAAVEGMSRLCELDGELVTKFIDAGALVYRRAGKAVCTQGEEGKSLFLVMQGTLAVERTSPRGRVAERIATLRSGALFGEMSVLTEMPRSATVRAERDSTLIEVSRDAIRELIRDDDRVLVLLLRFYRARLVGNLMASSPLFASLTAEQREDLLAKFRLREYAEGHVILREGERSDGLYLALAGELAAVANSEDDEPEVLGRLGPGDVFGEMSLLAGGESTSASVRADSRAWVLELAGDVFRALSQAHPEVGDRLASIAEDRRRANSARGELALAAVRPV